MSLIDYYLNLGTPGLNYAEETGLLNGTHGFSPDNPYYLQMTNATNKKDLVALREKAIAWEAEQQAYRQQLADQERLRDEQRQYDSPAARIARERAAGLNPDLVAGGSAGSAGSSSPISAPDLADAQSPELSDPVENASTAFSGISAISGLLGSVGTLGVQAVDMLKSIKTIPDFLRTTSAAADIVQSQADQQRYASIMSRIGSVASVAKMIPADQIVDDSYLTKFSRQLGIDDPEFMDLLSQYHGSPQMQKEYADWQLQQKESSAANLAASWDLLVKVHENAMSARMHRTHLDSVRSRFESSVANLALDDDLAHTVADTEVFEAAADRNSAELRVAQVKRDAAAFKAELTSLKDAISRVDSMIAEIRSLPSTPERTAQLNSLMMQRSNLFCLGSEQMDSMFSALSNAYQVYFGGSAALGDSGSVSPLEPTFREHKLNYYNFVFSRFIAEPDSWDSTFKQTIGKLLEFGVQAGLKKVPKARVPRVTGSN